MRIDKKFKEISAVIAVILLLLVSQWRLWIAHKLTVTHDSIIWYGIFSYFVDSLHRGFFPFWNPYMNCGENFFLTLSNMHLLDPSTLLLILTGKLLQINILSLYHYDLLFRYLIFITGSYLFFRYIAKYKISAFIAFVALSFSSFSTAYLRQHAFLLTFYLLPWILLYIFKFLEEQDAKFLLWLAFFLGISLPSYHSMFIIVSIAILLISLFFTKGLPALRIKAFLKNYKLALSALFIFLLLVVNLLPQYLQYSRAIVPTARLYEAPLAANLLRADFFNLFAPYSFLLHFFNWNYMSESFLYIGLVPFLFAIIGIVFSRHKYKWGFILTTIITIFLMLGYIYPLLCKIFPFFSIIRNMRTLGPFFIFCLTYFTCIGTDVIIDSFYKSKTVSYIRPVVYLIISICILAVLINNHIINIYQSLIMQYNILNGYLSPTTMYLVRMLINSFLQSYINVLLFAVGSIIIFYLLLKRPKINKNILYFVITSFMLIDLLSYNHAVYKVVTMPRSSLFLPASTEPVYNDLRISVLQPKYPFYAYVPAMFKIFTAYSTRIPWITTHVYEMKVFFEFVNNPDIPLDIKDAFTGISAPKLRLIHKGIVLPRDKIIEALNKIDKKEAEEILFIEENPPGKYSHLLGPLDNQDNASADKGEIQVISFKPNAIIINVFSNEDNFLYYSDTFDKAWRVFIDGREGKIYRANLAFKAAIIEKGSHTVRFMYDPRLYKFSLFCYLAGLLSLIIIVLAVYKIIKNPWR